MGLFSKKREEGEDAASHPKDASPHPKDASPHPSATQTPSPQGEGEDKMPPSQSEAIEGRTSDARPYEQNCDDGVGRVAEDVDPYEQESNDTVGADAHIRPQGEGIPPSPAATPPFRQGRLDEAIVGDDLPGVPNGTHQSLEQMVLSSFDELCDIAPTLTAAELLGSEDIASIGARLRRGYSLRDAYLLSQIKLHGSNGCSHLQKTSNTHRASTHLPDDVLAAYSIFMPKASRSEIQKNYMEYLARTGKA